MRISDWSSDVCSSDLFVEACHDAGLGLILDWVPGHFPTDPHGLGRFDGTALYEHADPREGFHQDWNTLIYNYGRRAVPNYLIANPLYWLKEHHLDCLRADAVEIGSASCRERVCKYVSIQVVTV